MGDSVKKMCKITKNDLHKIHWQRYINIVKNSEYVCYKCGHVANEEKRLCKAKDIM